MEKGERTKSAFEFARESTIQLIGLSTGVMTLTITFSKDLIGAAPPGIATLLIKGSWLAYMLSIIGGVWTLAALTGTLSRGPEPLNCTHIYGFNVRVPSALQFLFFLLGTVLAMLFAMFRF